MAFHVIRLLDITGMNDSTPKDTPSTQTPLGQYIDCVPPKETYNWI